MAVAQAAGMKKEMKSASFILDSHCAIKL